MGRSTAIGLLAAVALVVVGSVWWVAGSAAEQDPGPALAGQPIAPRSAEAAPGFKGAADVAGPAVQNLQAVPLTAAATEAGSAGLAAPASAVAAPATPPVAITGRVLDDGGRGVEGARVSFAANRLPGGLVMSAASQTGSVPPSDPETTTGRDGRFRLDVTWREAAGEAEPMAEMLRIDRVQLAVRHEAFVTLVTDLKHPRGERLDVGDLYVQPGSWVSGRIVDEHGRPLAAALVSASQQRTSSGGMRALGRSSGPSFFGAGLAESLGAVRTGADGRFRLTGLSAGEADVSARLTGRRVGHAAVSELVARGGRDVGDIVLGPGSSIAGSVRDERGRPIEGARLSVSSMARLVATRLDDLPRNQIGQEFAQRSFTDATGFFEIGGLGSGHYTVNVEADGFEAHSRADVAAGTQNLQLDLVPLGALLVRVVSTDDERALPGSRLTVDTPARGPRFLLRSAARPPLEGAAALAAAGRDGDPDGVFLVRDVGLDGVTLVAAAEGHATLSVTAPGLAPRQIEEFTIRLTPESVVAGVVRDREGQPLADARVELKRPAADTEADVRTPRDRVDVARTVVFGGARPETEALSAERALTQTAEDGSFELRGVAAGEWELTARAEGHVRSAAQRLSLQDGEVRRDLQLQLDPAGRVLGSVVEADGLPVADIEVVAEPAQADAAAETQAARMGRMLFGASEGTHRTRTDAEGNYSLEGLSAGRYTISLRTGSGQPRAFGGGALVFAMGGASGAPRGPALTIDVQPGVEVRADFVRPRRGLLGGRVLAAGGQPVPDARVSLRSRGEPDAPLAALARVMGDGQSVQSDEFGSYRFEDVEAGEYDLVAFAPGAALEKAVAVRLGAGEQRNVDIALGGAKLSGRVVREGTEEGAGGVTVTVVPVRDPASASAAPAPRMALAMMMTSASGGGGMTIDLGGASSAIRTEPDGRFEIAHLDPGSYRIETAGGGFASGEAGPFDLTDGQHRSDVRVEVLKGAVVSGRLVSATGQDLDGVPVRLSGEGRRELSVSSAGRFRFDGLAAGRYELEALGSGFGGEALATESLHLESGEERALELRTKT